MSFASSVIAPRRPFPAAVLSTDARHFQIATLASLVVIHVTGFDLGASVAQAVVTITAALGTQWFCARLAGVAFDWRSPLITGCSLTLLLRAHTPELWAAAAVLGIMSKYVLRIRGKHVFNPATFAIVALLILDPDNVWVSPGQWGNAMWLSLLLVCCAGLVLQRAERADTALAFLGCYAGLLLWRAWSLGDPLTIPLNQLQSGATAAVQLFHDHRPALDPGPAVDAHRVRDGGRRARLLAAIPLAAAARPVLRAGGAVAALAAARLAAAGAAFHLAQRPLPTHHRGGMTCAPWPSLSRRCSRSAIWLARFAGFTSPAPMPSLFNRSSKVVLAHSGERTVVTMVSDVEGDPKEFGIVIPVPTVIQKDQIRVVEPAAVDHLDAYTAPRLVEYYDEDPCAPRPAPMPSSSWLKRSDTVANATAQTRTEALGVKIEATYAVGEYDIVILSAKDSGGLLTWLDENGYKVPQAAGDVVGSYLRQNMHFFLAKVNLERRGRDGVQLPAADPGFVRLAEIHAADPARHGERRTERRT